jgi:hypothetical protein
VTEEVPKGQGGGPSGRAISNSGNFDRAQRSVRPLFGNSVVGQFPITRLYVQVEMLAKPPLPKQLVSQRQELELRERAGGIALYAATLRAFSE